MTHEPGSPSLLVIQLLPARSRARAAALAETLALLAGRHAGLLDTAVDCKGTPVAALAFRR